MNPGFPHLHLPTLAESSQKPASLLAEPPEARATTATAEPPGPIAVPAPPTGEPNPNHPHPSDLPTIEIPVVAPPAPPVIEVVTETMTSEQPVVSPVPQPESTTEPEQTVVTSDLSPPSEVHLVQSEVVPTVPVDQYSVPDSEQTTAEDQYEPPQETAVLPRLEAEQVALEVEPPDAPAQPDPDAPIAYLSLVDSEETASQVLDRAIENGNRFIAAIRDNDQLAISMASSLDKWRGLSPYVSAEIGSGQGLAIWLDVCGYIDMAALLAAHDTVIAFPGASAYSTRQLSQAISVLAECMQSLNDEARIFDSVEYRPIVPTGWARIEVSGQSSVLDDEEYHQQIVHKLRTADLRSDLIADLTKLATHLAQATAKGDDQ